MLRFKQVCITNIPPVIAFKGAECAAKQKPSRYMWLCKRARVAGAGKAGSKDSVPHEQGSKGRIHGFWFNVGGCAVNWGADSVEDGVWFGMTSLDDPP